MDRNRGILLKRRLLDEDDDLAWLGIEDAATLEWLRRHIEYERAMPAQWWPVRRYTREQLLLLIVLLEALEAYVQTFAQQRVKQRRGLGYLKERRDLWRWFHGWPARLPFRFVCEGLGIDAGRVFKKLRGIERGGAN